MQYDNRNIKILRNIQPGQVIRSKISINYIVLDHLTQGTLILRKDLLPERMKFDRDTNNLSHASVNQYLNEEYYQREIVAGFSENILSQEIDLTSGNGETEFGLFRTKVGLLTKDQYHKYKHLFGEDMPNWWWLATPWRTGDWGVLIVCSYGSVRWNGCLWDLGLRPDLVLPSDILVSLAV